MEQSKTFLLSVVTSSDGDIVYIHTDYAGLEKLSSVIDRLKEELRQGNSDHDHLFSEEWGGSDLTLSMLETEQRENCRQVHHVKIYSWTDEWIEKYHL